MRHFRVGLAVLATATALVALPTSAQAATLGCAENAAGTTNLEAWIPSMLTATNAHRAGLGLTALQLDPTLSRASIWKARDLARRSYFAHDDPASGDAPARTPWERLTACGFGSGGSKAENIAAGQQSGTAFIQAWINSPGHRANIQNAALRYVGFGVASSETSTYETYAVQMFSSVAGPIAPAVPAPAAPTLTLLELLRDDAARFVCPPASPAGVAFVEDAVDGEIDVTRTADGCLRIAPRTGIAGIAATVVYRARAGGDVTSTAVTMRVTVSELPRTPLGDTEPAPSARTTRLATSTATLLHARCRSRLAVAGWCWRVNVRGRAVLDDGSAATGRTIAATRKMPSGRLARVGAATTNLEGGFSIMAPIRPTARQAAAWLAGGSLQIRIGIAPSADAAGTASGISARIARRR